jgi:hypothetical protein
MCSPTASTPRATGGRGVRYARLPRHTLCSHDCQCASRKLSVHAVVLCASCPPLYCPRFAPAASVKSVVLPHAFGLPAIVAGWAWCATSTPSAAAASTATTPMHGPTHRRLRKALLRQRCTARPLFTRTPSVAATCATLTRSSTRTT